MKQKYYSIKDISKALHCADGTARKLMLGKPFVMMKNPKNYKNEACYHETVVLPACVKFKLDRQPPKGCVSIQEVANGLNVTKNHVLSLIRKRKLEAKPMGNGRKSVKKASLDAFLKAQQPSQFRIFKRSYNELWHMVNKMRASIFADSKDFSVLNHKSKVSLTQKIDKLSTKLQELKEIIA